MYKFKAENESLITEMCDYSKLTTKNGDFARRGKAYRNVTGEQGQ
jgi:hypothetical protein